MTYVKEVGDGVVLGNDQVEFSFSAPENGGLVSILDKTTGCELIRDPDAPTLLWRLTLRRLDENQLGAFDSSQARAFRWNYTETADSARVTLTCSELPASPRPPRDAQLATPDLSVSVTVSLTADSALSTWRMEVAGLRADEALYELTCPIISGLVKLGDPAPGESLAVPLHGEGYVFTNPYPVRDGSPLCSGAGPELAEVGIGQVSGRYPGSLALQMYAFYNDEAGLYFAAHDAGQNVKEFVLKRWDGWGEFPVLRMSHFPGEIPGKDVTVDYDCVVGVFHGDWYDAADIYKAWARQQWWCEKKLWDRDISDWMRTGFGVFQMSNYHIPKLDLNHSMAQIADTVNELSADAGVPVLGLVFNYEHNGAWTGPKGFFPPREGEEPFRAAMAKLRAAGNYGMVYVTGGCWYIKNTYDPPHDSSAAFEAEGRVNAVVNADGEIPIGRWYTGWESTRICAATDHTRELTASILLECLDLGVTVVQIDNFPCGGSEACYNPAHGHPLGYGPWWSAAWGRTLAETRRQAKAKDLDCAITTEGISENFIPWLDMYDQRAGNMEYFGHYSRGLPMGGETIPLFNYVYNEYIGSYYAAMPECNRPEVLYWTRGLGKALCQGVVPTGGRYFPDPPDHNPVTIAFYRKIIRATAQECWPYVMFGEMLRPPPIDVPMITAQYCKFVLNETEHYVDPTQRHEVQDHAVQHGAFRGRDGTVAYFFANVSEGHVAFDVELPDYAGSSGTVDVARIVDGKRDTWLADVALPKHVNLKMEPLSIAVLIVTQA